MDNDSAFIYDDSVIYYSDIVDILFEAPAEIGAAVYPAGGDKLVHISPSFAAKSLSIASMIFAVSSSERATYTYG